MSEQNQWSIKSQFDGWTRRIDVVLILAIERDKAVAGMIGLRKWFLG